MLLLPVISLGEVAEILVIYLFCCFFWLLKSGVACPADCCRLMIGPTVAFSISFSLFSLVFMFVLEIRLIIM
uniref:Putative product n=1 Tax=Xenopsylla cheopis TaxID=163159 RepID=A0A6M2DWD0_XENCH